MTLTTIASEFGRAVALVALAISIGILLLVALGGRALSWSEEKGDD